MQVEIYPNSTAKKIQERSQKFDEGVYLGILLVDRLYAEYLKTNKALWGKIKKMQRLKNTSFEKVDISYGSVRLTDDRSYNNDKRELQTVSKNSKAFTEIHLNDNRASITNLRLCKKLYEHE